MEKVFEVNQAREQQVASYQRRLEEVMNDPETIYDIHDPVMKPLVAQLQNHLKHVTYSFRIAGGADDYPYDLDRESGYPETHTTTALARVDRLFRVLEEEEYNPRSIPHFQFEKELGEKAKEKQNEVVRAMLDNPLETYDDFKQRRDELGDDASFPEIGWTLKSLASDLTNDYDVQEACEKSPVLHKLRAEHIDTLQHTLREGKYPYKESLLLVEDLMSFFDLVVRVNESDSPAPYHTARFEYNWHSLSDNTEHTLIPTMASLNLTDLIRLRGVPVGLLGVSTSTLTVDGFPQTPYEFFHHDVDHTRRMHQETVAAIEREGLAPRDYYERATALMNQLLPAISLDEFPPRSERTEEQQLEYDRRVARMVVLFEALHEDAYDCSPDSIADALLRAPMEHTPFERELDGSIIEYYTGPRASLLAHVYRKLAHTFYDLPEKRDDSNWTNYARNRQNIAQAAADMYRLVSDDPIDDEGLLDTCMQLVSSDEGFTDAFLGNFAHDIRRRAVGRDALRLMVTKPLNVNTAVRRVKRSFPDHKIHTLFGYSQLEYENPDELEETVVRDLANMSPDEYAISIGATPYGIGRLYPVIKDLGYRTIGIVASRALGENEECANGVDEIFVVRDTNWGGYRYSNQTKGLLSPTTRVFLGTSDSLAAYGGGNITAVALEEAKRRNIPVTYQPFEMSHNIAKLVEAQHGSDIDNLDFRGPAHQAWLDLEKQ